MTKALSVKSSKDRDVSFAKARSAKRSGTESRQQQQQPDPYSKILSLQRMAGNRAVEQILGKEAVLQRKCSCGASCPNCKEELVIQTKLKISEPGDRYEQEADRVADEIMRMPDSSVQRQIEPKEEEEEMLQRKAIGDRALLSDTKQESLETLPIIHEVLNSAGQPLDPEIRTFMESRFGHDFNKVRVHTDRRASRSAESVAARAYTVGSEIIFRSGYYAPASRDGQRLLAHELTHVLQQNALPLSGPMVQRQGFESQGVDPDVVAEREYGGSGAPKAQKCGRPSHCPPGFCEPYSSEKLAQYYRSKNSAWLMAGISAAVDARVVPLWREYLWGGSAPKNLSADFGKDFTISPTTILTTKFLYEELEKSLTAKPPLVPKSSSVSIDITTLIPTAIAELDDPTSKHLMNFKFPRDIPGNLAGSIGKDQKSCPAGAMPSPFNDERHASGKVRLDRISDLTLFVTPSIDYTVKDTIDLCPGDCGAFIERIATVPLSQFEATGISGDVPFTVDFPAPALLLPFTISAPLITTPSSTPSPKKP